MALVNPRRGFFETILVVMRIFILSVQSFKAFPLRSFFVILAISFGSSSLTLTLTAMDSAGKAAEGAVADFGTDAMLIIGGQTKKKAVGGRVFTLTKEDALRLTNNLSAIEYVVPSRSRRATEVKANGNSASRVLIVGTKPNYAKAWDWPVVRGRDITELDERRAGKVALIGSQVEESLFPNSSALNQIINVGNTTFTVVGILEERGAYSGRSFVDNRIVLPFTTFASRFGIKNKNFYNIIRVRFPDSSDMAKYTEDVRGLLRHLHGIEEGEDDDFRLLTPDEILRFLALFKGGLALFLGITAACSMTVGGFVLANLFSLSVQIRSTEIGIRKAVGARQSDISLQFLFESTLLTLAGGLLGVILGTAMSYAVSSSNILKIEFSWFAFIVSLIVSFLIGIIFAWKPAQQAAKLDAIIALRNG